MYAGLRKSSALALFERRYPYGSSTSVVKGFSNEKYNTKQDDKWFTLPPFTPAADSAGLGKTLASKTTQQASAAAPTVTAIKWVLNFC